MHVSSGSQTQHPTLHSFSAFAVRTCRVDSGVLEDHIVLRVLHDRKTACVVDSLRTACRTHARNARPRYLQGSPYAERHEYNAHQRDHDLQESIISHNVANSRCTRYYACVAGQEHLFGQETRLCRGSRKLLSRESAPMRDDPMARGGGLGCRAGRHGCFPWIWYSRLAARASHQWQTAGRSDMHPLLHATGTTDTTTI